MQEYHLLVANFEWEFNAFSHNDTGFGSVEVVVLEEVVGFVVVYLFELIRYYTIYICE